MCEPFKYKTCSLQMKDEITPSRCNYKQEEYLEIETKQLRKNSNWLMTHNLHNRIINFTILLTLVNQTKPIGNLINKSGSNDYSTVNWSYKKISNVYRVLIGIASRQILSKLYPTPRQRFQFENYFRFKFHQ